MTKKMPQISSHARGLMLNGTRSNIAPVGYTFQAERKAVEAFTNPLIGNKKEQGDTFTLNASSDANNLLLSSSVGEGEISGLKALLLKIIKSSFNLLNY